MRMEGVSFPITNHICLQQAFMVYCTYGHGVCTKLFPAPTLALDLHAQICNIPKYDSVAVAILHVFA